jgi:hypothetical protein
MKINWVIENFVNEASYTELANAVKEAGHPLIEFKVKNGYTKSQIQDLMAETHCVVFNGSIEMAKLLRKDLPSTCQPVIYCNQEKYKCSSYYSYFGKNIFNDKYVLMPLFDLQRNKYEIFGMFGREGVIFLRPDSGEKTFQAGLMDILDFDIFVRNHWDLGHNLVLVSTPKNIQWEGRFIVSRRKELIAASTYRYQGQRTLIPSVPDGAMKKCRELLQYAYYDPDSVFCYDLCQDADGDFWLLELTSFSSAGLYAADKKAIVKYVSEIALEDFVCGSKTKI